MLSDPKKKIRYDNGEDLDDPMGGMHHGKHSYCFHQGFPHQGFPFSV